MALIARDNTVYYLLTEPLRFGQHKGVEIGTVIAEFPDYIRYCLDNKILVLAGECEEEFCGKDESDIYNPTQDPFYETFYDQDDSESIADYLD